MLASTKRAEPSGCRAQPTLQIPLPLPVSPAGSVGRAGFRASVALGLMPTVTRRDDRRSRLRIAVSRPRPSSSRGVRAPVPPDWAEGSNRRARDVTRLAPRRGGPRRDCDPTLGNSWTVFPPRLAGAFDCLHGPVWAVPGLAVPGWHRHCARGHVGLTDEPIRRSVHEVVSTIGRVVSLAIAAVRAGRGPGGYPGRAASRSQTGPRAGMSILRPSAPRRIVKVSSKRLGGDTISMPGATCSRRPIPLNRPLTTRPDHHGDLPCAADHPCRPVKDGPRRAAPPRARCGPRR